MKILACALLLASPALALASGADAAACAAGGGHFLSGEVVQAPRFARGHERRGVELSHSRLRLRSDADGALYAVAMDNVFAAGYDPRRREVPAPLSDIQRGDRLQLCGAPYDDGSHGLHWVHDNCGDSRHPDGWVRKLGATGQPGPNLEGSRRWCGLWQR